MGAARTFQWTEKFPPHGKPLGYGEFLSPSFTSALPKASFLHVMKVALSPQLQASVGEQLTSDYPGTPGWDDNAATFEMIVVSNNLHGDYQLANGLGHNKANEVLKINILIAVLVEHVKASKDDRVSPIGDFGCNLLGGHDPEQESVLERARRAKER